MITQIKRATEAAPIKNTYADKNTTDRVYDKARIAIQHLPKGQPRRLALYLLVNPVSLTSSISRNCSIGNVSHVVAKVRPILEAHGVTIEHCRAGVINQFGEPSEQHIWWMAEVGV